MSSEGSPLGAVIRAYNERYGAMDAAMWCLSLHCRAPLVEQRNSSVIEALVDTIKDWWGVSYVPDGTSVVMARRLATLGFSREMFAEGPIVVRR